jgi:hypothetical protein
LGEVEALSVVGDVNLENGKPLVHAHVVLGKRRLVDPETGLPLLDTTPEAGG